MLQRFDQLKEPAQIYRLNPELQIEDVLRAATNVRLATFFFLRDSTGQYGGITYCCRTFYRLVRDLRRSNIPALHQ